MSFGAPGALALLAVPLFAVLAAANISARVSYPGLARLAVTGSRVRALQPRIFRQPWLLWLAVSLAIVGLARPRWGSRSETVEEPAREILIALDLSRSMGVSDVEPTRIDRAHAIFRDLLSGLGGERAGVIVFSGGAYVQVPLSSDYQIMREFLPVLRPGYMPQGGTNYGAMLRVAQEGFSEDQDVDRYLVVISDGESTTDGWPAELARLQQRHVHIIALAVGTLAGGDVPRKKHEEKSPGRSHLEAATLQKMAQATDGIYRDATGTLNVSSLLAESVELGKRNRLAEKEALQPGERFQWFLVPALLLGLLGLWREIPVRPRPRVIRPARVKFPLPVAAEVLPALVIALAVTISVSRAHDLADPGEEPTTAVGKLRKLVAHVAAHPALDVTDLLRIGELTVNYGIETFDKGDGVAEGAITDALEAVRQGERMAPRLENWARLRSDLQRLQLRRAGDDRKPRPPEQKKEALDEEDIPPQTNGQGSQQTSAESTGKGGVAMTDATIGELRKEPARAEILRTQPRRVRAGNDAANSGNIPKVTTSPLRNLLLKRFREVAKDDTPGVLYQALNGDVSTEPAGGKDW